MTLKVYRIDTSVVGKVFNILRKTDLPVAHGISPQFKLGNSVLNAIIDYKKFENHYIIKDKDELDRFENALGNSWIPKEQYYIRHPKIKKDRLLIEANKFHEYI
ncbi:hypothetical protein [Saccharibacillus deserti]|uniref:hypothetical protein n=1 Tax=Saccharibacillus deserti TaxID=1634444 RepID=UPI0015550ED2|nr:hypothetical protein [Saccharibacillus deserti]